MPGNRRGTFEIDVISVRSDEDVGAFRLCDLSSRAVWLDERHAHERGRLLVAAARVARPALTTAAAECPHDFCGRRRIWRHPGQEKERPREHLVSFCVMSARPTKRRKNTVNALALANAAVNENNTLKHLHDALDRAVL